MTDSADGHIEVKTDGHVLMIGIDRPAKRNGFTPQMYADLARAYTRLESDPALRVGLLHGQGGHFTGGLDLPRWVDSMNRGESMTPAGCVDPLDLAEPRRSKPVVCAVGGVTYTIGIELMLAADIVVAADDCRFSQLEVKRGIMATGGATLRIAERAGTGNAMLYLLTGDEFDSATALRLGLVQKVVPKGNELAEALSIARRVAAAAPQAVRATLENCRIARELGHREAMARFRDTNQRLSKTADAAEGVAAFRERREPRFTGN